MVYLGHEHIIEAEGLSDVLSEDVGTHWVNNVHAFLLIEEEAPSKVSAPKAEPKPEPTEDEVIEAEMEAIIDEIVDEEMKEAGLEPEVVEAPKPRGRNKNK